MRLSRSGSLMSQIRHIGGRVFERILANSGVDAFNGPQGRILDVLWQQDGIPIRKLSEQTGLAVSTLTSMIDRMEASDLLKRQADPHDRRVTLIFLTQRARSLQEQYDAVSIRMNEVYFRGFTDAEIEQLEQYLNRILDNVKEESQNE